MTCKGWHKRGGVVGRGVLIDYVLYAQKHNIKYSAIEYHEISHEDLEKAAQEQGVTFRQGDILIVRSGVTKWYNECTDLAARDAWFTGNKRSVGVAPTKEAISWVWNHHFAAVAGDALAWEPIPYPADKPCKSNAFRHFRHFFDTWKHSINIYYLSGVHRLVSYGIWRSWRRHVRDSGGTLSS